MLIKYNGGKFLLPLYFIKGAEHLATIKIKTYLEPLLAAGPGSLFN